MEKNCQSCKFHSQGIGAVTANSTKWMWQECSKNWGKPTPIGVLKNLCGLYQPKIISDSKSRDGAEKPRYLKQIK